MLYFLGSLFYTISLPLLSVCALSLGGLVNPAAVNVTFRNSISSQCFYRASKKEKYLRDGIKEPEVPLLIIPTIEDVNFNGEFDYISLAQSPNYTPSSADFIIEIIKEYIEEC